MIYKVEKLSGVKDTLRQKTSSSQQHWWRIGFLVTLALFLATAGVFGFYVLRLRGREPLPRPAVVPTPISVLFPTQTPAPIISPSPDETARRETYTNKKYGYSIKYPEGWSHIETNNFIYLSNYPGLRMQVPPFEGISFEPVKQTWEDYRGISVEILPNPDKLSLVNYFNKYNYECPDESTGRPVRLGERLIKSEELTIENNVVWELGAPGCAVRDREVLLFSKWILLPHKDKIFRLAFWGSTSKIIQEPIFHLMLPTFKFLE